jgi:hypothetical protein
MKKKCPKREVGIASTFQIVGIGSGFQYVGIVSTFFEC